MIENKLTGYASVDQPWLKYYTEEQRNAPKPADMSIYQRIKENIDEYKDLYAIRFEGNRITYAEMIESIDKTADALKTIGIKENDIVVCYMPSLPHEVYMLYACSKIGALINFVKPMTSTEQVCAIINEFKAPLFVTFEMPENDRKYIIDNSCVKNIVNISMCENCENGIHWNDFIRNATVTAEHTTKSNNEGFFIAHTGGSTGKSKAVLISNNALNIQTHQIMNSALDFSRGDSWMRLWPLFSVSATAAVCHLTFCATMESVILPFLSLETVVDAILKEKANHYALIDSIFLKMMNDENVDKTDISFIKSIGIGGTKLDEEFEQTANDFLRSKNIKCCLGFGYGLTENASGVALKNSWEIAVPGSVGIPQIGTVVGIFEIGTTNEKKYNEDGEVCVLSDTFMVGYYNDEEATAKMFKKHPDGKMWLHTGDLGYMTEDGILFVKGRLSRVIFTRLGYKFYPDEIENALMQIKGIKQVAIVPEEDKDYKGHVLPACCLVLEDNTNAEEVKKAVSEFILNQYGDFAVPQSFYIMDSFPLTAIGKIDFAELERKVQDERKG